MIEMLDIAAAEQKKLDAIDDQLSLAIRAIEDALRERISVRIDVTCPDTRFSRLAFGKHNANWMLLVELSGAFHPLVATSRETRAEALAGGHIRRLIEESATLIRAQAASREAATQAASELLTLLGAQKETSS